MSKNHVKNVRLIASAPHLIGLEKVILSACNMNYYNRKGELVGEIDIYIETTAPKNGCYIHLVEYKASKKYRTKAYEQLERSILFFREELDLEVAGRFVCDQRPYHVEVVRF